jgi:hypothetical protein
MPTEQRKDPRGRKVIGERTQDMIGPVTLGFLIAFVGFGIIMYSVLFRIEDRARLGCERLDQVRQVEYEVLADAATDLAAQAVQVTDPKRKAFYKDRAADYERHLADLEATVEPFRQEPNPETPVDIDCDAAYPDPWPFG